MKHLMAALLLLAGCATLSDDQCLNADWEDIGRRDGMNGRSADLLTAHQKACGDVGVRPDAAAWERGRQDGLRFYCTPETAFRVGQQGRMMGAVCPADPMLARANRAGRDWKDLEDKIDDARADIRDLHRAAAKPGLERSARYQARAALLHMDIQQYRMRQRMIRNRY